MLENNQRRGLTEDPSPAGASHPSAAERLFDLVRKGDSRAVHELRRHLGQGVRFLVSRQAGTDKADALTDEILTSAVAAVTSGEVATNEQLLAATRRLMADVIARSRRVSVSTTFGSCTGRSDTGTNALITALQALSSEHRTALRRFYLGGWSAERVCREHELTEHEFSRIRTRMRQVYDTAILRPRVDAPRPGSPSTDATARHISKRH